MNSPGQSLRAAVFTLGCRLNQAETALICEDLAAHGYRPVPWGEPAELLVINSCTVTGEAASKTRKAVHAARRRCPEAFIVVVGCEAELAPEAWGADLDVDLVLGNVLKTRLASWLPPTLQRPSRPAVHVGALPRPGDTPPDAFTEAGSGASRTRTRAYLKVQEGCDFSCRYCIVPRVRGPARSRDWDDTLRAGAALVRQGYRELVLAGVNLATYRAGNRDLADLVSALLELGDGFRLRLGSTEPGPALLRLVERLAGEPRLCRFLHVPLQHGADAILAAMGRRYRVADYADLVHTAAARLPGLGLGTDVIVGFPGETEAHFEACCQTLQSLPINHLHVFTYSPRQGTPAATLPGRVPPPVAAARAAHLSQLGQAAARAFAHTQVGQILEVLTESRRPPGLWEGWSDNYLRVEIASAAADLEPNRLLPVRIDAVLEGRRLRGSLVTPTPGPSREESCP